MSICLFEKSMEKILLVLIQSRTVLNKSKESYRVLKIIDLKFFKES